MAYQKILIDNLVCTRRFHVAFDDEDPKQQHVKLECFHCGAIIFERKHHPQARLLRDENLAVTTAMSEHQVLDCQFKDTFSPQPVEK